MTKQKAGDWYLDVLGRPCVMVADGYGTTLAVVVGEGEARVADARKMAAANELLAACELMLTVYGLSQEAPHAVEVMRAAIAKAKGAGVKTEDIESALAEALSPFGNEFLDPPDGGNVTITEQVRRMSDALVAAREALRKCCTALAAPWPIGSPQDEACVAINHVLGIITKEKP